MLQHEIYTNQFFLALNATNDQTIEVSPEPRPPKSGSGPPKSGSGPHRGSRTPPLTVYKEIKSYKGMNRESTMSFIHHQSRSLSVQVSVRQVGPPQDYRDHDETLQQSPYVSSLKLKNIISA